MTRTSLLYICGVIFAAVSFARAFAAPDALPYAFPNPMAIAMAADGDPASYSCHASCGYAILAANSCSTNASAVNYGGPYDQECLCEGDAANSFKELIDQCLDCGWCLYTDYFPALTSAIIQCSTIPITPTGSTCSPTGSFSTIGGDYTPVSVAAMSNSSNSTTILATNSSSITTTSIGSTSATSGSSQGGTAGVAAASASSTASSQSASSSSSVSVAGVNDHLQIHGVFYIFIVSVLLALV